MKQAPQRGPGFAPIRRGLLAHLLEMSDRATKLYLYLHLKAQWKGPKRGWVEASFEDMARELGWSSKTVQRAIRELAGRPYIEVERATSQYELTRIRIFKYDVEDPASTVDKSVHTSDEGVDRGVDRPLDKSVHTSASISQSHQDLQAPKKLRSKEEKKGTADAVRRPIDAEQQLAGRKSFSPSEKKAKLTARLARTIDVNGNKFEGGLDRDERAVLQAAINATRYDARNFEILTSGFIFALMEVYEKHKNDGHSPGNLCSKVIDRCVSEQEACKTLGSDPSEYFWPPDFQEHRDRLRAKERASEQGARGSLEARA